MTLFEKYVTEAEEDLKIDNLNIKDKEFMLPGIKHKWVSRLINHRIELKKLINLKQLSVDKIVEELKEHSPVILTIPVLIKQANNKDIVKKINVKIEEQETIILYIDKLNDILKSMTWDIKNLIDTMKLEEN